MAGDTAGEGKLLEQLLHTLDILAHIGINLAVGAVQPVLGYHGVAAMTGAGQIDHVQIILVDDTIQMGINKVLSGNGTPVTDDLLFDVFGLEGFLQQRIIQKIQLTGRQKVGSTPPGVQLLQHGVRYHMISSFYFRK